MRITKDPQGYWFTEGDTKVLFYQAERKALPDGQAARSNYFHPLYDLDGNVLTEDFPRITSITAASSGPGTRCASTASPCRING